MWVLAAELSLRDKGILLLEKDPEVSSQLWISVAVDPRTALWAGVWHKRKYTMKSK